MRVRIRSCSGYARLGLHGRMPAINLASISFYRRNDNRRTKRCVVVARPEFVSRRRTSSPRGHDVLSRAHGAATSAIILQTPFARHAYTRNLAPITTYNLVAENKVIFFTDRKNRLVFKTRTYNAHPDLYKIQCIYYNIRV